MEQAARQSQTGVLQEGALENYYGLDAKRTDGET
jgi:hypothetical protein